MSGVVQIVALVFQKIIRIVHTVDRKLNLMKY